MKKYYLLAFLCMSLFAVRAQAQDVSRVLPCATDEHFQKAVAAHPEILKIRDDFDKQVREGLKRINYNRMAQRTMTDQSGNSSFWYDVAVVVHVIHDYNNSAEYLTDDAIFNDLLDWNLVYAKENSDTNNVIAPYAGNIPGTDVRYIGNAHIRLHFASRDPNGNPTKGITRRRSFDTYSATDQAKYDVWPTANYVNIWIVNNIVTDGGDAAAYAQFPSEQSSSPATDGVISDWSYVANDYTGINAVSKTINHELGHFFNLLHPWNNNGSGGGAVATACGDDGVDDTPPTKGHYGTGCALSAASLYDSTCAFNYFVVYTSQRTGLQDSLVNYPDTVNAQNIMDYTYCSRMFTAGQVARMHASLNSDIGNRNNLWDTTNLQYTGVWDANFNPLPRLDLKPIPEFAISKSATGTPTSYADRLNYFTFPNTKVTFYNESWNDTVTNVAWTLSNGATRPNITSTTNFTDSFTTPGWVSVTMTATGNNTGDTTVTWPRALFVANATGTPGASIDQEFSGADTANWPMFNYYNNGFKWQIANVGKYDNYSIEYAGFDSRLNPPLGQYPVTGPPNGDIDDFFSIPVDLSGFTAGQCSLNFDYSGATRSSNSYYISDTMEIDYTVNKGLTWTKLATLSKLNLINSGVVTSPWVPTSPSDWSLQSIDIPAGALTNYTTFRWRYRPGSGPVSGNAVGNEAYYSTGNNFYMDEISFKPFPASVANVSLKNTDIAVVPNPTNGDAYVVLKDAANTFAKIIVTDITGKVVYTTSQQITGNEAQIQIPRAAISVAGMYIVQASTGAKAYTQKLVVY